MLTLEQARKIQKKSEIKTLLIFIVPTLIIAIVSYLVFSNIEINEDAAKYYTLYYLVPFVLWGLVIAKSGITKFFLPKEFEGEVLKIEIYRAEERKTKSGGFDALQDKSMEAELMVKGKNEKTILRIFPNGDTTSRLREGDRVTLLRFVDEPIVIKGMYWNQTQL